MQGSGKAYGLQEKRDIFIYSLGIADNAMNLKDFKNSLHFLMRFFMKYINLSIFFVINE